MNDYRKQDGAGNGVGSTGGSESFVCDLCGRTLAQSHCTHGHNFGAGPLYACRECHPPRGATELLQSLERFIKTVEENKNEN